MLVNESFARTEMGVLWHFLHWTTLAGKCFFLALSLKNWYEAMHDSLVVKGLALHAPWSHIGRHWFIIWLFHIPSTSLCVTWECSRGQSKEWRPCTDMDALCQPMCLARRFSLVWRDWPHGCDAECVSLPSLYSFPIYRKKLGKTMPHPLSPNTWPFPH